VVAVRLTWIRKISILDPRGGAAKRPTFTSRPLTRSLGAAVTLNVAPASMQHCADCRVIALVVASSFPINNRYSTHLPSPEATAVDVWANSNVGTALPVDGRLVLMPPKADEEDAPPGEADAGRLGSGAPHARPSRGGRVARLSRPARPCGTDLQPD
jgi:hypothetical protein